MRVRCAHTPRNQGARDCSSACAAPCRRRRACNTTARFNFYTARKFGSKFPFYRPRSGRSNFSGFLSALLPPSRIFYMRTSLTSGVPGNGHLCSSRARRAPMPRSAGGSTRAAGWRAVAGSRCPRVIFSVCLSALLPSRLNYSDYLRYLFTERSIEFSRIKIESCSRNLMLPPGHVSSHT